MDLKELRDTFAKLVETLDKLIDLEEREKNGEDVADEVETETGRMLVQMMKLEAMK